jgi:hypothetical protein
MAGGAVQGMRLADTIAARAHRNYLAAAMAAVPLSVADQPVDPETADFDPSRIPSGVGEAALHVPRSGARSGRPARPVWRNLHTIYTPPLHHLQSKKRTLHHQVEDLTDTGGPMPALKSLTDEELAEILALVKNADSVELKLTVRETARAQTVAALGIDSLDAQMRQVFFFDTPELALNQAGVVVRARRRQREEGDTVVKLRPVVSSDLPEEIRRSDSFRVEVDAVPGGHVCSASFKGVADNAPIRMVGLGQEKIGALFSKEQRAFYSGHAPEGIGLDDLSVLGPIPTLRLKTKPEGFGRKLVGELWLYPDGSQIVELSTRVLPSEAFQAAAEARVFLAGLGVDLEGEQQTKTKTALEFFTTNA